ncbi:MAG: hypothetical protein ACFFBE_04720 [Promethearchaeota archaeon]
MGNKRICYCNFKNCPCRVNDIKNEISYCNFIPLFAQNLILDRENDTNKTDFFLRKVCPDVRNEILHHDYRAKQLQKREKEFLENVKPGDVCFCNAELENVIFIKHPSNVHGDVKYRASDGRIKEAPSFCFSIISKGNKCAKYETNDKNKMEFYERLARRYGFRTEIQQMKEKYILRIYSDNQDEVNEFVVNLYNNRVIDDFYDY